MVLFERNGRFGKKMSGELEDNPVAGSEVGLMTNLKIEPAVATSSKKAGVAPLPFSNIQSYRTKKFGTSKNNAYFLRSRGGMASLWTRIATVFSLHKLRTYTDIPACSQSCPTNS